MMIEIKFRGKRTDNSEWVYGFPYIGIPETYTSFIIPVWLYNGFIDKERLVFEKFDEIDPKTIGQFTGLKDKNDKEIYKGDILKSKPYLFVDKWINSIVFFNQKRAMFMVEEIDPKHRETEYLHEILKDAHETEIIGNIYENPELLKS